ncbi:hypothetical protein GEV33_001534 [Tenebrio molitor]|jgi:hypothetical protein|uniref:CHHC U11-48K-type domain-containing protein n=1 Tax=Tenebrio molitor TaxID=7067 RepID=A0A8J6LJQ1_TENMO|nr:hypothetical protein GEV33_001534 [Tenebrio molitor]
MYFQQEYDSGDDVVQCPYDKFHRCLRHRMTKHMWKCHRREYERDRNIRYFELNHKIEQLRPVQQLPQQPQQLPQQPQQLPQQPQQLPQQSQQPQQIQGQGLQPPHQEQQQQQEEFQQVLQQLQQLLPQEEEESWDNLNYATYIPPCKCRFVNKLL